MTNNPWQEVLDTLYQLGGRAEFPSKDTEGSLDPDTNLVAQTDFTQEEIEKANETLAKMSLATDATIGNMDENEVTRYELTLTGDGYSFAHDRQQEKRNLRSNRSVTLLTVVLAIVGLAQATALTANATDMVTGIIPISVTSFAAVVLVGIFAKLGWDRWKQ